MQYAIKYLEKTAEQLRANFALHMRRRLEALIECKKRNNDPHFKAWADNQIDAIREIEGQLSSIESALEVLTDRYTETSADNVKVEVNFAPLTDRGPLEQAKVCSACRGVYSSVLAVCPMCGVDELDIPEFLQPPKCETCKGEGVITDYSGEPSAGAMACPTCHPPAQAPRPTEEGDRCLSSGCQGFYRVVLDGDCRCHISPPCSACTDAKLTCGECGDEA